MRAKERRARGGSAGFTLAELLVVLVILGVMTALSIPTFMEFYRDNEARQTTEQLTQVLRFAHQESIFKRKIRTVGIDFETDTYYVKADPVPGYSWLELKKRHQTPLPEGFEFQSIYFPNREEEEDSDEAFFNFYPDGTAEPVRITIDRFDNRGRLQNRYIVRINGVTGKIRVKEKKDDEDRYF